MNEQEYARVVAKNLRRIMLEHDKTQADVSRDLKISKATLSSWMNGTRTPRMNKIDLLCHYFNITRHDLMSENNSAAKTIKSVKIPVYGRVAAGIPLEMIEDIVDMEEIPATMAHTGEFFALKIRGQSMEPRIQDGDVVIVRKQNTAESGEIVIAAVNGSDATCKRLKKYKDGIILLSNNPAFEPMVFNMNDVEKLPVTILGKVVELRGKL